MLESSTVQLLILLTGLLSYWVYQRYKYITFWRRHKIPGPDVSFFWTNLSDIRGRNVLQQKEWVAKYGKIVGYVDASPMLLVADIDLIRQIQTKDWQLFASRRRLVKGGLNGDAKYIVGLADNPDAGRWKEMRSLITTAFTSSKIKAAVPLISDALNGLMDNIKEREKDPDFEIFDLFQRLTMDTIGQSAFGIQMNVQQNPNHPLFVAARGVFEDATLKWSQLPLLLNFLFPEFTFILYPIRRVMKFIGRVLGQPNDSTAEIDLCRRIVAQRKANVTDHHNPYSRSDLLQLMIEASLTSDEMNSFSDSRLTAVSESTGDDQEIESSKSKSGSKVHHMNDLEVAANAALFFNAGFETTATTLAFLTHVLVNRLEIQDRIREEVTALYNKDGKLEYNAVHGLPFLDSVLYETLRYFPPITGFVTRQSTLEYQFKDMVIPPDTSILIPAVVVHHDPDNWEDPQIFDPMRFYGENRVKASSPAFQAFGGGPRNCVGLRFAILEAKMTMARILLSYRLTPGPRTESFHDLKITYKPISQSPTNGIFVKAVPVSRHE